MENKTNIPKLLSWIESILTIFIVLSIFFILSDFVMPFSKIFLTFPFFEKIFSILSVIFYSLILYGVKKRNLLIYKFALFWFIIEIIISLVLTGYNMVAFGFERFSFPILQIILLILLIKVKEYFTNPNYSYQSEETEKKKKSIKRHLLEFLILILIVFLLVIFSFFLGDDYKKIQIGKEINQLDFFSAIDFCMEKESSKKDLCILTVIERERKIKPNINHSIDLEYEMAKEDACIRIKSEKYKDRCYLSIKKCNLIKSPILRESCFAIYSTK